jgi:DNA-directed RNA polymerase specialized sigma subunit
MYINKPLTKEQADFAAENHNLVYAFLNRKGYPEDKFYDIVIFGLLQAARAYSERPELQRYKFSTIAFSRMRSCVYNYCRSESRKALPMISYDEFEEFTPVEPSSPESILLAKEPDSSVVALFGEIPRYTELLAA